MDGPKTTAKTKFTYGVNKFANQMKQCLTVVIADRVRRISAEDAYKRLYMACK